MSKWDNCLFLTGEKKIKEFFAKKEKTLIIMGKGFDPRTCKALKVLKENNVNIEAFLIDYSEDLVHAGNPQNVTRGNKNFEIFQELCEDIKWESIEVPTYKGNEGKRTLVISESVRIFTKEKIQPFDNVIIDISAMTRAVGFSIIKRIRDIKNEIQKMYIIACENSDCDDKIKPVIVEGSAEYLQGFNTFFLTMESDDDETIWLPVLGMNEKEAFDIIEAYLKPAEICPIVPFPSINVKRSEDILRRYGQTLFQILEIEKRNIIYVPENFPLIVYDKLYHTVKYYEKALNNKNDRSIRYAFSSQSSKMIDIGMLPTILSLGEENIKVGIVIVENQGYALIEDYDIKNEELYCVCLDDSEYEW